MCPNDRSKHCGASLDTALTPCLRLSEEDRSPDTLRVPELKPPCPLQIRLVGSLIEAVRFIFSHRDPIRYN